MTEDTAVVFSHPVDTVFGAMLRVHHLFAEIEKHHGKKAARAIFKDAGGPMSPERARQWRNWQLLDRLDQMKPKPVPYKLARDLALEKWGKDATAQRIETIDKHIRELVKKRNNGLKDGTWQGPGAPGPGAIVRIRSI
jgi:hypothetical protein